MRKKVVALSEPASDEIRQKILHYLRRVGKAKNRDVAKAINVDKPTVDRAINELAKEDEVEFLYLGTSYVAIKGEYQA